jgi:hypothetical protein
MELACFIGFGEGRVSAPWNCTHLYMPGAGISETRPIWSITVEQQEPKGPL